MEKVFVPGLTIQKNAISAISEVSIKKEEKGLQSWYYTVYFDGNAIQLFFKTEEEAKASWDSVYLQWDA